jgi:hypothetical protein
LLHGFDDSGAHGIQLVALWTLLAEAAARSGDAESSRVLIEQLRPCRDQFATTISNPIYAVAHATGIAHACLGDLDNAVRDVEHAISIHERMRAPFHIAYSEAALADILARRGAGDDSDRARAYARRALTVGQERSYGYVIRDATAALDRLT